MARERIEPSKIARLVISLPKAIRIHLHPLRFRYSPAGYLTRTRNLAYYELTSGNDQNLTVFGVHFVKRIAMLPNFQRPVKEKYIVHFLVLRR